MAGLAARRHGVHRFRKDTLEQRAEVRHGDGATVLQRLEPENSLSGELSVTGEDRRKVPHLCDV